MAHTFDDFSVGEVMIVGRFHVTPAEMVASQRARMLEARLAGAPYAMAAPHGRPEPSASVPASLLLEKAAALLATNTRVRAATLRSPSMSRAEVLRTPVVGEPVNCVATVRSDRGATLARFEVGAAFDMVPTTPRNTDRLRAA
jgi:hypothetical protein